MKLYSIEEKKMMEFGKYCVDTCGCTNGCCKFNTVCSDYTVAKKKTLDELKAEADAL